MSILASQSFTRLDSVEDKSVNFVKAYPDGGKVESRFVQRTDDRFIVYISSMSGCDKACRFCWLTQMRQTTNAMLSREEMLEQARHVLENVKRREASVVHFNFMARGEPLANPNVDATLFAALGVMANEYGLKSRIKISTILPTEALQRSPDTLFNADCPPVDLYYSCYSVDPEFRKRWLPKAAAPEDAFRWLRTFQFHTGNRVILHWALIDGENDTAEINERTLDYALKQGVAFDLNLVRYNPANEKSKEASEQTIAEVVKLAERKLPHGQRVRLVSRVGYDVAASCGMFVA